MLPDGVRANWQDRVIERLFGNYPGVRAHPVLGTFLQSAGRLLALLLPPGSPEATAAALAIKADKEAPAHNNVTDGPAAALDSMLCWPEWRQAFLQTLLLRCARLGTATG